MAKELVSTSRMINDLDIFVDDEVAEDEVEIDYFFPRRSRQPLVTLKFKAKDLFPKLFEQEHKS